MSKKVLPTLALIILLCWTGGLSAQDEKPKLSEKDQKAQDAVQAHVGKLKGGEAAQYSVKTEKALGLTFPEHTFVIVRFRQFPIARQTPEGLEASNIFVVDKENKFDHLKGAKALEKFFQNNQPVVKEANDAKAVLASWLTLAQEFHQDGMYKFEVLQKDFGGDAKTVRGRAVVMQGGNGELAVTLTFADGKLTKVAESAKINSGPRPICQATLLLDGNPLVRRIAEQDLLIMGLAAHEYLMEQRAKAGPELQQAIDQLWRKIQTNGR